MALAALKNNGGENLMAVDRSSLCQNLVNFYNLPGEKKAWQLETVAGRYLLSQMPHYVRETFVEMFLSGQHWGEVTGGDIVRAWFFNNSPILQILADFAGSYRMLEYMYHLLKAEGPVDNYFLASVAGGQALRNRYDAINNYGVQFVNQILERQETCNMVDVGSGPGRNGVEVTLRNPEFRRRLRVQNIENDPEAISKGLEIQKAHGLTNITFVNKSMTKINGQLAGTIDFGLNVGVVCGMPRDTRVWLLKNQLKWFRPGGIMVVAGLTNAMIEKDGLCAAILEWFAGWILQFRPSGELAQDAIKAGWEHLFTFHEQPTQLYDLVVLRAPVQ